MTEKTSNKLINTGLARVIALVVGTLIAIFLVYTYKDDFKKVTAGTKESGVPINGEQASTEADMPPELAECLQKRVGDVDKMKTEGVLSDEQYASFKSRAEELCRQQNPG